MGWPEFRTSVPGKWILCGEHAVLQGATAIAAPHADEALEFEFYPNEADDRLVSPKQWSSIGAMLDRAQGMAASKGLRWVPPRGRVEIRSSIPVGAGMGSSAALCVAVTRWLGPQIGIQEQDFFEFARSLEDHFHGRSSGLDVATVLSGGSSGVVRYKMGVAPEWLPLKAVPKFTFHDTGMRARTSDCVAKVDAFRSSHPESGRNWDAMMGDASKRALSALQDGNLPSLAAAMNDAHRCFEAWGLVPGEISAQRDELVRRGALGVKLTGAGGGGFWVALWDTIPL